MAGSAPFPTRLPDVPADTLDEFTRAWHLLKSTLQIGEAVRIVLGHDFYEADSLLDDKTNWNAFEEAQMMVRLELLPDGFWASMREGRRELYCDIARLSAS